jgi:hypothetical protein
MRECGVVERLSAAAQNALINITTIFLGLAVGSKLVADKFLDVNTLGILGLGIVAFSVGTAAGVLIARLMNQLGWHADQSADRLRRRVGGAHGGAGQQPPGPGGGSAQLPVDACHGT